MVFVLTTHATVRAGRSLWLESNVILYYMYIWTTRFQVPSPSLDFAESFGIFYKDRRSSQTMALRGALKGTFQRSAARDMRFGGRLRLINSRSRVAVSFERVLARHCARITPEVALDGSRAITQRARARCHTGYS